MLLSKIFSVCMMLVVMFLTTARSFIAETGTDTCCSHKKENKCGPAQETAGCSNEGNPFQFCHCCPHIWAPPASDNFQPSVNLTISVNVFQPAGLLPEGPSRDFWQPPRCSWFFT